MEKIIFDILEIISYLSATTLFVLYIMTVIFLHSDGNKLLSFCLLFLIMIFIVSSALTDKEEEECNIVCEYVTCNKNIEMTKHLILEIDKCGCNNKGIKQ